jgi:hypothetical protein
MSKAIEFVAFKLKKTVSEEEFLPVSITSFLLKKNITKVVCSSDYQLFRKEKKQ